MKKEEMLNYAEILTSKENMLVDRLLDRLNEKVLQKVRQHPLYDFILNKLCSKYAYSMLYVMALAFMIFMIRNIIFYGLRFTVPVKEWLMMAIGVPVASVVLVYAAEKMNAALGCFVDKGEIKVKSLNFFRVLAVSSILGILGVICGAVFACIYLREIFGFFNILISAAALVVLLYLVLGYLLDIESLGVKVDTSISPAQELISIPCVLLNICIKLMPIFCCVAIVCGTLDCLLNCLTVYTKAIDANNTGLNMAKLTGDIFFSLSTFAVAFIPMVIYFQYLFFHLTLDLIKAVLSLAEKKD